MVQVFPLNDLLRTDPKIMVDLEMFKSFVIDQVVGMNKKPIKIKTSIF